MNGIKVKTICITKSFRPTSMIFTHNIIILVEHYSITCPLAKEVGNNFIDMLSIIFLIEVKEMRIIKDFSNFPSFSFWKNLKDALKKIFK